MHLLSLPLMRMYEEKYKLSEMLGSFSYMHCEWKNCVVAWKCQYTRGLIKKPTLEDVSQNLWIWPAFIGVVVADNEINMLGQSSLFNNALQGFAPKIPFAINGKEFIHDSYITDVIYPVRTTFVKGFSYLQDPKKLNFKQMQ